jgi:hypothetical protein
MCQALCRAENSLSLLNHLEEKQKNFGALILDEDGPPDDSLTHTIPCKPSSPLLPLPPP